MFDCKIGTSLDFDDKTNGSAKSLRTVCLVKRIKAFEEFQNCVSRISDLETLSKLSMERLVIPRSNMNSDVRLAST